MKIAFVYDRINKFGGAERILLELRALWPKATFFTAVYNPSTASWAKFLKIKSTWLQFLPLAKTHHELYPWLTSMAFESLDLKGFDLVISITSAEAKAVITLPSTLHLCYCLTPTRYLWSHRKEYLINHRLGKFLKPLLKYLQQVDLINSQRPDKYIAISKEVQSRIKQYYHQDSIIIYPPVDTSKFSKISKTKSKILNTKYFLIVSRLVPYKKVDLAIKACRLLKQNLVIVGSGSEKAKLKKISDKGITFLGEVSDEQLVALYQNCRALIMPQKEDFGIVAVEAQAAGKPVIAFNCGGSRETIIDHKTGLFFDKSTVNSLSLAMQEFNLCVWDVKIIQAQAQKFDSKIFKNKITKLAEAECLKFQNFR